MPALFAPRTVAPTAARPVRSVVLAASVACATWAAHSAPAASGTATTGSHITQVTLYPGSATVERSLRVPAGSRSVTFRCLPQGLDARSLQVVADAPVRVGNISVQVPERPLADGCARPLDERVRAAQDQLATAQAETDALELAHTYLKTVADSAPTTQTGGPGTPGAGNISVTTDALRRSAQDTLMRLHQFTVPQRITVPSGGQRVTLALGSFTAPTTLITRTAPAMEEAACLVAELGIGFVGNYMARTDPNVVAVLPQLPLPDLPIWLTVHREIRTSRKIRAVYDFLASEVPLVL